MQFFVAFISLFIYIKVMLEQRLHWDFQEEVGHWGSTTFPKTSNKIITLHIQREVDELFNAAALGDRDNLSEECADIYLMLLHLAHRNRFDLWATAKKKLSVCQFRSWGKPDAQGVVEHIPDKSVKKFKSVPRKINKR